MPCRFSVLKQQKFDLSVIVASWRETAMERGAESDADRLGSST